MTTIKVMKFTDVVEPLRKRGYVEKDTLENHRVFYEFGTLDFLTSDVAKKFEFDYKDGVVEEITMTQYWFGTTTFKKISTIDELLQNV